MYFDHDEVMASEAIRTSPASKQEEEEKEDHPKTMETLADSGLSRKDKRKVAKKMKRKQIRKEIAEMERAEEEARLNDLEEQRKLRLKEQEEAEILEMQRKEFEERERLWMERAAAKLAEEKAQRELQQQQQEEEAKKKQDENDIDLDDDDGWEYVEEGPAEIIWQGNEIIVKKKRVRVAKKNADEQLRLEDADRPTSNPLPPQSEVFVNYKNASSTSTQQVFDSVAQQIPNFGTEQDKAHCPFHIKTGACRFGSRCSRVHFYPDKSCTLLMKNMYNGPGLAWDQDEGLEHTDEEVEHSYEEFYEDVHTEFLKFGEIVNFKVCRNGSFHLRGNVYVHYKLLESAVGAYNSINGRYFAGKQITCEFVGVTRWKVALCGEYMKSRLKTCSRGTACNFIHCFRNPGGDYEWADWDNPPPKYWMKKMVSLFGPSNEIGYDGYMDPESWQKLKNSPNKTAANHNRYQSRRSRSRSSAVDYVSSGSDDHSDGKGEQQSTRSSTRRHSSRSGRKWSLFREHERCENLSNSEDEKGLVRSNFGDNFVRDRNRDRNCIRSSHFRKEIDYLDDQNLNEQSTSSKGRLHRSDSSRKTSRKRDHLRGRVEEDIRHNMSYLSNSPGRYDPNSGHKSDQDQFDHRETTSYSSEHEKFKSRRHIGDHDLQDKQRLDSHRESSGDYYEKRAQYKKLPNDEKPSDNHKEKSDPSEVAHHGEEKQDSGRRKGRSSDWKQDQRRNKHRGKVNNEGFSNGVGESKERSNSVLLKKMTEISDENGSSGRKDRRGRKKSKENIDKKTSQAGLEDRKLKDSEKRLRSRSPVQSSSRSRRKIGQCNDP